MASAPRRRARRMFAYWRSEQRILRKGLVALLISTLAALIAGITTSSIVPTPTLPTAASVMGAAGVVSILLVLKLIGVGASR